MIKKQSFLEVGGTKNQHTLIGYCKHQQRGFFVYTQLSDRIVKKRMEAPEYFLHEN